MNVAFSSVDAVPAALEKFRPDAVVSIFSPGYPVGELGDRPHLSLRFHDLETRPFSSGFKILPDHRHVEVFLDFVDHHRPGRLLIHCTAGLSRSPALAIAAAARAGRDPAAACAEAKRLVPHAEPNRRLLDLASEHMGIDLITPALSTFTYTRATHTSPDGERAGLSMLFSEAIDP